MGRPKNEPQAKTTTRLYSKTLRLLRTLASWKGMSMPEYVDELAREAAKRDGAAVMAGLQMLIDEKEDLPAKRGPGRPCKEQEQARS